MVEQRNIYKGHRYVPKIMGEWNQSESYEGLSIVTNQGDSYTSKKRVPTGIELSNEEYWVVTGNYNAQIENYRSEVKQNSQDLTDYKSEVTVQLAQITVNVKDFDAQGNGVNDDTVAIQKAIDYVASIGGGTVLVPEGIYMIKANVPTTAATSYLTDEGGIAMKDGVTLIMTSKAILKAIPNSQPQYQIVRVYNKKNVSIIGGSIMGDRIEHTGTTGEWGYGISVTGGENILIENVNLSNCWGDGINIQVFRGNDTVYPSRNVTVRNVYADNNRRQGMSIEGMIKGLIESSTFINTKGTLPECGVDVEPWSDDHIVEDVVFRGCTFSNNNGGGLTIMGAGISGVHVDNCLFENNKSNEGQLPIYFCKDISVENSRFYGGVQMCSVTLSKNISFDNNTVKTVLGIVNSSENVRYESNYVDLSHINIYDMLTVPLYKGENLTKNLVFRDNMIIGSDGLYNTRNLLYLVGGFNTLIEGNTFQYAVGVIRTADTSHGIKILNNRFENFKNYAIMGSAKLILTDNIFTGGCYGNPGEPIIVSYNATPNVMTRNMTFKQPTTEKDEQPQFGLFANRSESFLLYENNHVLDNI